jgi:hypothetical protein
MQEPWPWETDYLAWKQLLIRSTKAILFNSLVAGPLLMIADCLIDFPIQMKMEDMPSSKLTYLWQFVFFLIVE